MRNYILYNDDNIIKQFVRCKENEIELYELNFIETELEDFYFKPGYEYKFINGEIIETEKTDINYLLSKLSQEYIQSVASITSGVTSEEVSTWTKQESEARSWLADNNYSTPLIDAICSSRGVPKSYLVNKIIEKADLYASAIGALTGERQKQEKLIKGEITI